MGKKGKGKTGELGRALLRDRFGASRSKRTSSEPCVLHTADIEDGYQWDRLNLKSVTEESSFQEFLSTAQLAGTEFHAEKLNIKFVNPNSNIGLISERERELLIETHRENKDLLKIPRRPKWDKNTAGAELQAREKEDFLEWRRKLALVQEAQSLTMTPYEKNLEFWRQLWRVVERSDVVVQIVDARNPLLFHCPDLEVYVKEVNPEKMNMILMNKADFLSLEQRRRWASYFGKRGIKVAFFSATLSAEKTIKERKSLNEEKSDDAEGGESSDEENSDGSEYETPDDSTDEEEYFDGIDDSENSAELLTREKLIEIFKTMYKGTKFNPEVTTVGLVGYPNVGKSSTINALLMDKKVSVSATPGKTKHFQTLYVDEQLLLCDCPGLVMPSFVCTKAEMILNGILPIDQLRDHVPAVTLVGTLIPRHVVEDTYGIMLPPPLEGEEPDRPPTAEEILNTYGYNRGFMTQNGQPDNPRSARYVLKDFVNGKLLYCVAPPDVSQSEFHKFPPRRKALPLDQPIRAVRAGRGVRTTGNDVDKLFFQEKGTVRSHIRGPNTGLIAASAQNLSLEDKPWKKINKHANKKKREKSRRLYAHLDQH